MYFKVNISPTQFHFIQISEVHHLPSQNIKGNVIEEKWATAHHFNHLLLYFMLSCFGLVWLFCDPMDCSPPGSSVHGISQARIPEWVSIFFSRGSSWHRDWSSISYASCIAGGFFTAEPPGKFIKYMTFAIYQQQ